GSLFDELTPALEDLTRREGKPNILFLDTDTPTLVNRFKETRRRHPMSAEGTLIETIQAERARLVPMRELADIIIDTTSLSVKDLKETLEQRITSGEKTDQLRIHIVSFGYKYGIPMDADLLMDVRFLPNPHYIPTLQEMTGKDAPVRDFVMSHEVSQVFFEQYIRLLEYLIPNYIEEGKTHLVVAIGCTGGRHRSVTLAIKLHEALVDKGFHADVHHRDTERV
ncbi:MAG: RNase adapter RapZ, partial [Clostridiales bacterium]|nr:RNase adapter RapZ [Clostridiales bacterium]